MIVMESSNTQPPQPSRTVTPSQEPVSRRRLLQIGATSAAGLVVSTRLGTPARAATTQTVVVSGSQIGVSPPYIGATEGNVRFDVADLQDAGINTYRIYGGMCRWEWQNDSSTYGSPTIDQIKANPGVINWTWWDNAMTTRRTAATTGGPATRACGRATPAPSSPHFRAPGSVPS
jgi:hypothetical protein